MKIPLFASIIYLHLSFKLKVTWLLIFSLMLNLKKKKKKNGNFSTRDYSARVFASTDITSPVSCQFLSPLSLAGTHGISRACGACERSQQRRECVENIVACVRACVSACFACACTPSLLHPAKISLPSVSRSRRHGRTRTHERTHSHGLSRPSSSSLSPSRSAAGSLRRLTPTRCSCSIHT